MGGDPQTTETVLKLTGRSASEPFLCCVEKVVLKNENNFHFHIDISHSCDKMKIVFKFYSRIKGITMS